ncbi:MAG: hypothetical protein AAGH40_10780 [Verrucomicrobiota bacterium]
MTIRKPSLLSFLLVCFFVHVSICEAGRELNEQEKGFVGTWVVEQSGAHSNEVSRYIEFYYTDRSFLRIELEDGNSTGSSSKAKWKIRGDEFVRNFGWIVGYYSGRVEIRSFRGSARAFRFTYKYGGTGIKPLVIKGTKYSNDPKEKVSDVVNWLNTPEVVAPISIIDPNYVSKFNRFGYPPLESGWVYDDRIGEHRPPFNSPEEVIKNWVVEETARTLISNRIASFLIKEIEGHETSLGGAVIGGIFDVGLKRAAIKRIDALFESAYPNTPKEQRILFRAELFNLMSGKPGDQTKRLVSQIRAQGQHQANQHSQELGDQVYQALILYDIYKHVKKSMQ